MAQQPNISKKETVQTAVDWYRQEIMKVLFASDNNTNIYENDIHEQAKQIEKKQIIDAFYNGTDNRYDGEQYYNETYNK